MGQERQRTVVTVVILSVISIASKLMGLVREQIIASSFGVSAVTDAYVSAQLLPMLLDAMLGAAIATVLVPLFTAAGSKSKPELMRLLLTTLGCLGGFYCLESLVLWVGAPVAMHLLVPGLGPNAMTTGVVLARTFAPLTALLGLSSLLTALLNVHRRFLLTGIAALCANVAVMVAALIFHRHLAAHQVAWAFIIGTGAQLLLLLAGLRGVRLPWRDLRPDWAGLYQTFKLAVPLMLANAIGQITPVTDKYLASRMPAGSIAALSYAMKLVQLPVGVLVMGLSTVLFARFSQLAVERKLNDLGTELGRTLQGLLFVMLPASGLIIVLAHPIVAIVFQRGQFDHQAVAATTGALIYYSLGLLPMSALPVLTNVLFALRNTRAQLAAGLAGSLVYVGGALVLGPVLAHRGLALAFSLNQFAFLAVIGAALGGRLGWRPFHMTLRSVPGTALATAVSLGISWGATLIARPAVLQFALGSTAGGVVYLAIHLLLGSEEAGWLVRGLGMLKRRLTGLRSSA